MSREQYQVQSINKPSSYVPYLSENYQVQSINKPSSYVPYLSWKQYHVQNDYKPK